MPTRLCELAALESGLPCQVVLPSGHQLAVFFVGGEVFVTDDVCTHGEASLAEGLVEGYEVECPYHQGRFDIRTGAATAAPCTSPLRTYPVLVREGSVFLDDTQ